MEAFTASYKEKEISTDTPQPQRPQTSVQVMHEDAKVKWAALGAADKYNEEEGSWRGGELVK